MLESIKEFIIVLLRQPYLVASVILLILIKIFYKKIMGKAGEYWVKKDLKKLDKEYLIINDAMLIVNNKSTQIDHLVISKYGIFVIETKHYHGKLTGNDYDKNWRFKAGRNIYYINNPVHQNYGHVQSLKELLNLEENKFIPLVCITSDAKVNLKSNKVITINDLLKTIHNFKEEVLLNYKEIYNKILSLNITDKSKRKQHIKDTKKIVKQKNIDNINKCPKCGHELVERNGKYGRFIGCSNYPKCKYIKNN